MAVVRSATAAAASRLLDADGAAVEVGVGRVGFAADHFVQVGDGAVELAQFLVGQGPVQVNEVVVGIEAKGGVEVGQGGVKRAVVAVGDAPVEVELRVGAADFQGRFEVRQRGPSGPAPGTKRRD